MAETVTIGEGALLTVPTYEPSPAQRRTSKQVRVVSGGEYAPAESVPVVDEAGVRTLLPSAVVARALRTQALAEDQAAEPIEGEELERAA